MGLLAAGASAPKTTWAFVPATPAKPALDLRSLNEPMAGQSGFVRRSSAGDEFALGDGTPVRFWGVNVNVTRFSDADLERHARWLASLGVNMARISGATIQSKQPLSEVADTAEDSLRNIWRTAAVMKKQGIYLTLHHYWAKGSGADVTRWGIEGYTGKTELWGLLFFNPQLQAGYRTWLKKLYTEKNPFTGIPLAQDPVVGLIILQNEDSLLFWTSRGIKPEQRVLLARLFAEWLGREYGSLDAAFKRWNGPGLEGDQPEKGIVTLLDIGQAVVPKVGVRARRITDQYRFFVETMRRFNSETAKYLHEELGCRQLICAGNWRTANDTLMLDAERYADTANDVIAKNHYFNGVHEGPTRTYAVSAGDLMADRSALMEPWALPLNMKHVAGHPNIITESTWTHPNQYQSEAAFLAAAYGSLSGLDGFFWFGVGGTSVPEYEPPVAEAGLADLVSGVPSPKESAWRMGKFQVAQPMIAGMFPAAALIYRRGYVQEGQVVVHEERPLADLWERKAPLIWEDQAFDPNRDTQQEESTDPGSGTNPLAFLVGRVEAIYGGNPARTRVADLAKYIDTDKKLIRSVTGELTLDYGKGLCRLDAPKAQGACGLLGQAGKISLSATEIESGNPYASVLLVSLDDRPLSESRRILVQVGTTARPGGWRTEPAEVRPKNWKNAVPGERILNVGHGPWLVEPADVTVSLANANLTVANLLDPRGGAVSLVPLHRQGGRCQVILPPETMYFVLAAENSK
jgi:hypothetical protein